MSIAPEPVDFEKILEQRRKEAAQSIRAISHDELAQTFAALFQYVDHPWTQVTKDFLAAHTGETFAKGNIDQGEIHFVYAPTAQKGFWYVTKEHVSGMGPFQAKGLKILSEIIAEKRKSGEFPA